MSAKGVLIALWAFVAGVVPASLRGQDHLTLRSSTWDSDSISNLINRSNSLREASLTDSALSLLKDVLEVSRVLGYERGIAEGLMCIAFCYQDKGNYSLSRELLYQAWPHALEAESGRRPILLSLYNGLGGTYTLLGNNDSAIHFFYKAMDMLSGNSGKDSFVRMQVYSNLGTAWIHKAELDRGMEFKRKAAALAKSLKDSLFLAHTYSGMSLLYLQQQDTATALAHLRLARGIYERYDHRRGLKYVYYAIGNAQANPQAAIPYYQSALEVDTTNAYTTGIYQAMGQAYYHLGRYEEAASWYQRSEQLCIEQALFTDRLVNYKALSEIYAYLKDYPKAYHYEVAYANLNDSLLNIEKEKVVQQLYLQFETAEKDKLLAQSESRLYRQRQWIIGGGAGALIVGLVLAGAYRNSRYKQRMQAVQIRNFDQQQKISQLNARMQGEEEERSRIARELHDGINVLLSATKMNYAALGKEYQGLPEAPAYGRVMGLLNEMSQELRTITYKLVPELLIRQSLPDAVETFCELIRKGNSVYIEFQSWGSFTALPAAYCFAVYRIVQELVHNIIKHAGATGVLIQLRHQDNLLCLTVEDNGTGFDPEGEYKGMGLKSIRGRIQELGGQISFTSRAGEGTSVEVEFTTEQPAEAAHTPNATQVR